MRDCPINSIWEPAKEVHALLRTWSQRKLDELSAPDTFIFFTACADLALHGRPDAQAFLCERLYGELPGSVLLQVRPPLGKLIVGRCVDAHREQASLLAIDLIIDAMRSEGGRVVPQSYDALMGLTSLVFEQVLDRRRQLGYEMERHRPFHHWREEAQVAFVDSFHRLVWAQFLPHKSWHSHKKLVEACEWDLHRSFLALGELGGEVESAIRVAMGRRVYELAREYHLLRLPRGEAEDLMVEYMNDKVCKGASLVKQLNRLQPELRAMLELEEDEEEPAKK